MSKMPERIWANEFLELASDRYEPNGADVPSAYIHEYIRADLATNAVKEVCAHLEQKARELDEAHAEIERLRKALEQAVGVTALRYLPPKEAEGSDGRVTQLPAGLACSHTHEREGWTDYTNKVISENPELVSELIKRGSTDE